MSHFFNVPPICRGTRCTPCGHMALTLTELLFHSGQTNALCHLLTLSGGQF